MFALHRFYSAATVVASSVCLFSSTPALAYKYIDPQEFAKENCGQLLGRLGAHESLLKVSRVATGKMADILSSEMVQGMARGSLAKEEWDQKYMRADALYIYRLGQALAQRVEGEEGEDRGNVMEFAEMFLGYGKHFDRLKKYGLSPDDELVSSECDDHIRQLSNATTIHEFYLSILTDMIPYVVFSNYLLESIEPDDGNPWIEYAQKYGDLNGKYAKEKLGKTVRIANEILETGALDEERAAELFEEGFGFEEWFIRNAFTEGFIIKAPEPCRSRKAAPPLRGCS